LQSRCGGGGKKRVLIEETELSQKVSLRAQGGKKTGEKCWQQEEVNIGGEKDRIKTPVGQMGGVGKHEAVKAMIQRTFRRVWGGKKVHSSTKKRKD